MSDKTRFIYALSILVGTIIGVGLFGLPYVASKSGFFVLVFYFIFIGFIAIFIHLFYGEVAAKTPGLHRLPGYAEKYLGLGAKRLAFINQLLGLYGALLAYLIVGGEFLANLFGGHSYLYLYTFIFFALGAFLIWRDEKSIGPMELILLVVFFIIIVVLLAIGSLSIKFDHLLTFEPKNFFVPYGVVIFSIWGASMMPEVKEILKGNLKQLRKVIICSIAICLLIYFLFSLLVVGVTGEATTKEAIIGLKGTLGKNIIVMGFILGIIATFTSFITLGLTVKKIYLFDYHLPKFPAWFLACFVPVLLFIIGLKDFINVISLTGAIMLGIEGILIFLIYLKFKKKEKNMIPQKYLRLRLAVSSMIVILLIGVVLEVFFLFNKI